MPGDRVRDGVEQAPLAGERGSELGIPEAKHDQLPIVEASRCRQCARLAGS
jgi:hypothetical protein